MSNNFFKENKKSVVSTPAVAERVDEPMLTGSPGEMKEISGKGVATSTRFVVPPVVDETIDVPEEWKAELSDDQIQVARSVLARGVDITAEEYSVLSGCESKSQFAGFISYEFNKQEYAHLDDDFSKVDILKMAKNPLNVTVDDIDEMLGYKSVEEIQSQTFEVSKKIKKDIENQEIDKYITARGRKNADGSLDRMLNMDEIGIIERNVKRIYEENAGRNVGMQNNDRLGGVVMALNDMSLDAKRTYEITKMHYCNKWGLTPESVDNFLQAMIADRTEWLDQNGINSRKDIGRGEEFDETMKANIRKYCKKIPGWKEGDIVYESEFVKTLDQKEYDALKSAWRKSRNDENKAMISAMGELWDPKKLKPRREGLVKNADEKTVQFLERRKKKQVSIDDIKNIGNEVNANDETAVQSREDKKETPKERSIPAAARYAKAEHKPAERDELYREAVKETLREVVKEETKVEEVKPKGGTLKLKDGLTLEENIEYLAMVKKYTDMGLSQDQAIMLADKEYEDSHKEITPEQPKEVIIPTKQVIEPALDVQVSEDIVETLPEPVKQPLEHVETKPPVIDEQWIRRFNTTNLDDYTTKYEKHADPNILRNTSDRVTKMRLYRESKKNGRVYYMINSNYEVMVNKIYDRNQISFILQLLQNGAVRDINLVDSFIKKELLQIVYKCIDFNFEVQPSYQDFVQCLCESDLTGLMMLIAIVNIPEDKEGRIPLTIQSLQCTNPECKTVGLLKEPIKIDLKQEFANIYDIDKFSIKYNAYKNKTYKTIQDAYYDANESVVETYSDEVFSYEIGLSSPTVWKTSVIRDNADSSSYRRLADSMNDKRDFITRDYDIDDILEYMNSHSYQDFRYRAVALQDIIAEVGEGKLSEEEENELKMLGFIGMELNKVITADSMFNMFCDVIDFITVKDVVTGEVVSEYVTLEDHYGILDIVTQGPTPMVESIIKTKEKYISSNVATDLEFTSEELAGKFDFESQFKSEDEFIEDLKAKNAHLSPEALSEYVNRQIEIRTEAKKEYDEKGLCICGNNKWKLNYTNILFFWAYNH